MTFGALLVLALGRAGRSGESPNDAPALSPKTPSEPGDEVGDPEKDTLTFDDFSWREFIALNWPACEGRRGVPATNFRENAEHVVWGTWKSVDELFPPNAKSNPPTDWDKFDGAIGVRCVDKDGKVNLHTIDRAPRNSAGRKYLAQVARLKQVNETGIFATPLGPLVAQNSTYVRYEVRVNEVAYNFIKDNKYYLAENLPSRKSKSALPFPPGSIIVKAAWMELTPADDRCRFYCTKVDLIDGVKDSKPIIREATVGLVGLHIAQTTPLRPSWIWSTFEHVDNTEPGHGAKQASFNRGNPGTIFIGGISGKMPPPIPEGSPLPPNPTPTEVERMFGIHHLTRRTNARYYSSVKDTVWRNYRLIATQWVLPKKDQAGGPPKPDPGDPLAKFTPFPSGSVVNTTIETYSQTLSCLACHRAAQEDFRFVFFPSVRAIP